MLINMTMGAGMLGAGAFVGMTGSPVVECYSPVDQLAQINSRLESIENSAILTNAGSAAEWNLDAHKKTLQFVLMMAAERALGGRKLTGGFLAGDGYLYSVQGGDGSKISNMDMAKLNHEMESIINENLPITACSQEYNATLKSFAGKHEEELLNTRVQQPVRVNRCGSHAHLYQGQMLCTTGMLKEGGYTLQTHKDGVALGFSRSPFVGNPQMEESISDVAAWGKAMGVSSVGDLNALPEVNRGRKDYILSAEYRQEGKIASIIQDIMSDMHKAPTGSSLKSGVRVICIAGPTSSGKTTFATKTVQYLRNNGMPAQRLTVDHYYLPLDRQPKYQARNQRSDVDYDHIESMDVELVNDHIMALINGETIKPPVYNMKTGFRDPSDHTFKIPEGGILVIEGIHALNPQYTSAVPADQVYKVFLCPLTGLVLDDSTAVDPTDARLLRRMSRDYLFRGHSASRTLQMWGNVLKGEAEWIFPFVKDADFVMNSAHEYELGVLKPMVEPLLRGVKPDDQNYEKAQSLLRMLDNFSSWGDRDVPPTSLLREFIGNGAYDEH
jgi:uridine kinase